jgi:hypothetical protein
MKYILILPVFCLTFSCTEDYRLRTMEQVGILCVEGCITNEEGPYMVRLTEYLSNLSGDTLSVKPFSVTDAQAVITDDAGTRDELRPLWRERVVKVKVPGYYREIENDTVFFDKYYLLLPKYAGNYDSILLASYQSDPEMEDIDIAYATQYYEGIYYTTSITGIPGHAYTLTVERGGRTWTATDHMPRGTVLDSVVMRPVGNAGENKGDGFHVPYLYFPEPQDQENWYLFTHAPADSLYKSMGKNSLPPPEPFRNLYLRNSHGIKWHFEPVSDRLMSAYVANYKLGEGSTSYTFYSATDVDWQRYTEGYMDIYMLSVSKQAYRYYQAVSEQFYQDGGAFSPAPCSPPTNVSNGGQGFFMAAPVAVRRSGYFDRFTVQ